MQSQNQSQTDAFDPGGSLEVKTSLKSIDIEIAESMGECKKQSQTYAVDSMSKHVLIPSCMRNKQGGMRNERGGMKSEKNNLNILFIYFRQSSRDIPTGSVLKVLKSQSPRSDLLFIIWKCLCRHALTYLSI